jgi:predicted dehydrogenase
VHDPETGGGRIIGEACHFIDLLAYIAGSPVRSVAAFQMERSVAVKEDKMSIALSLMDGSVGTVNYFGNGSKQYPKEGLEVFSEGRVLKVDNFRRTTGYGFGKFKKLSTRSQDKGHNSQFQAVVERVLAGGEPLMGLDEMVNATLASFAAKASANEGRMINILDEYAGLK